MLKRILIGFAIALVVLLAVIAMQPSQFRVERSVVINASVAKVFPHVNQLTHWQAWSPWVKLDPQAKNIFEGPQAGEGAKLSWHGNDKIGEGSMTITESYRNERIRLRLDFVRPFKNTSNAEFTFTPSGDQTRVVWAMYGENNFIAKTVGLFIDCEKMLGGYFEEGLNNLKAVVEK